MLKQYLPLAIWVAIIAALFVFLWRKGYLLRLSNFVQETREELKKCTWPTWDELKGSTVVVMISILILGAFTIVADQILYQFVRLIVRV
jgi:preprotein translocase subunit SecE